MYAEEISCPVCGFIFWVEETLDSHIKEFHSSTSTQHDQTMAGLAAVSMYSMIRSTDETVGFHVMEDSINCTAMSMDGGLLDTIEGKTTADSTFTPVTVVAEGITCTECKGNFKQHSDIRFHGINIPSLCAECSANKVINNLKKEENVIEERLSFKNAHRCDLCEFQTNV